MKAIMRVSGIAKEDVRPFLSTILSKMTALLTEAAKNPANPKYNHFMFETLAVLVRNLCAGRDRAIVTSFQQTLFPTFKQILASQVGEFMPYALQIMAQLLRLSPDGITGEFQSIFPMILHPAQYQNRGNVPALVELLKAYLRAPGDGPNSTKVVVVPKLGAVLGVWQELCRRKSTELHALRMLEVIVGHLPVLAYEKMLGQVFGILIQRLLKVKGPRFKMLFIPTFLYIVGRLGGTLVFRNIESLKPGGGMFATLIRQVVLSNVSNVTGKTDRKTCAVGLARMLGDTAQFREPSHRALAVDCVQGTIAFFQSKDPYTKPKDDEAAGDLQEGIAEIEYNSMANFSRLNFATSKRGDLFSSVPDPKALLRQQLQALRAGSPGLLEGIPNLSQSLSLLNISL